MKYIDKHTHHSKAHAINIAYLQECYREDLNSPIPSPDHPERSFDDFKKPEFRKGEDGWEKLLLDEQECRCAYCMRRLKVENSKINFEHIIPRSLKEEFGLDEYEYYTTFAPVLKSYVQMSDVFTRISFNDISDIATVSQIPHITALANIVATCNGKRNNISETGCCCNNSRSDKRLMPLVLMQSVDQMVTYGQNGYLDIKMADDTVRGLVVELNDETLMKIREVWYMLSRIDVNLEAMHEYSFAERRNIFLEAYGIKSISELDETASQYIGGLSNEFYWNLLLAYDWFYIYYKCQRKNLNR